MTSTSVGPPAVRLDHVTKRFGTVTAVDDISLTVPRGGIVAFLGPNGAGKTTTIDMLLGLARPTAGDIRIFGHSPQDAVALGQVSAVMQTGGLLKDFTVEETLAYLASFHHAPRPVAEVIARAGLTKIAQRRVVACSGGEQQRLRFAIALLPSPQLLILDEPTAGMDVEGRREFWSAIRRDAEGGRTVLFATHYLDEADAYADRIVLISAGAIVADGTTAEIKSMASGRTVTVTWPDARTDEVAAIPGVDAVEVRGQTVHVHTTDSDPVARYLLTRTDARDLVVTSRNLEDAFVALTSDNDGMPSQPARERP